MRSVCPFLILACATLLLGTAACSPKSSTTTAPQRHEHQPPHGGTPVVLGEESCHLELVLDAAAGRLSAYVLDGEMENFIRIGTPSFQIVAKFGGREETLVFRPVANPATGETAEATSLYEAQAEWLKTTREFEATLASLTVRGRTFANIAFNFPRGNDAD